MLDIFLLSIRQITRPRRLIVILLIAAVPVLLATIARLSPPSGNLDEFRDNLLTGTIIISSVLPLITLIFSTAVFSYELEDRTLGYLYLKPLARWAVVVPKLAAALLVSAIFVVTSGVLTVLIAPSGDAGTVVAVVLGLLVGVLAYGAVFTWSGLVTGQALALGLVYVFVWEASVANFLQGVRYISVRQYTLGTIHGIDADQFATRTGLLDLSVALPAAALVFAVFLFLSIRRLIRMDVP